ncbi:MAG: serine/threonine protein kinase [Truepera sp.]|nr:serine/threonine protein kinase [Truepera sp.]
MRLIGLRFGPFQVLRQIARGALSRVFLVSDGKVAKAAKLFPLEHRRRAEQELAIGLGLSHPHINAVEAPIEIGGYPGILMNYVAGRRLGEWPSQPDGLQPFLDRWSELLDALGYLHTLGIVHSDVKPENILISRKQGAVLIDFDLALRVQAPRQGFAGTVAFASPEQARGEPAAPASDLYAAGIILYRGLTGQVPFSGSVREVFRAHGAATPTLPSQFDSRLAPYDALVTRLLAKQPEDRYQHAAEVLAALATARSS